MRVRNGRGFGFQTIGSLGGVAQELLLYDDIGKFWGEGIGAVDVAEALRQADRSKVLDVRINSPGGVVHEGVAIYNQLAQWPGRVHVHIDGLAASIASLIAMAGDRIYIAENATMMVHSPWGFVAGNATEMRKEADVLDLLEESGLTTYARRTGLDMATLKTMLAEETFLTGAKAVELGFADELVTGKEREVYAWDRSRFSRNPVPSDTQPATPQTPPLLLRRRRLELISLA